MTAIRHPTAALIQIINAEKIQEKKAKLEKEGSQEKTVRKSVAAQGLERIL